MKEESHIHAEPGSVNQFTAVNWGKPHSLCEHGFLLFVKQAGGIDERPVLHLAQADCLILPWSKTPLFGIPCSLGNTLTHFPCGFLATSANSETFCDFMGTNRAFKHQ